MSHSYGSLDSVDMEARMRLPRVEVAALWRLHALSTGRRRTVAATSLAPVLASSRRGAPPRSVRLRSRARSPSSSPRSSSPCPPEGKRARRRSPVAALLSIEHEGSQEEEEVEETPGLDEAACSLAATGSLDDRHRNYRRQTLPPLPYDVMVLVLSDVAALCPRSAFVCRLVSRTWRKVATEPNVQAIVWQRCIGEEGDAADSETESRVNSDGDVWGANASAGGGRSGADDCEESGGEEGGCHLDVAAALALVERHILEGRDRRGEGDTENSALGTTRYSEGSGSGRGGSHGSGSESESESESESGSESEESDHLEWVDQGEAVQFCAGRRWWRAAETLVWMCGAVDRHRSSDDDSDTGESEVLDAAVDAGDESLSLALLRSPQTAVSMSELWPIFEPASRYTNERWGNRHHPVWHSVEALRAGRFLLAAALVRPREDGGGGQHPMPLLMALCTGDVPWTERVWPALEAAERGVTVRVDSTREMDKRSCKCETQRDRSNLGIGFLRHGRSDYLRQSLQQEIDGCSRALTSLENPEARDWLQVVLDRLLLYINLWTHA